MSGMFLGDSLFNHPLDSFKIDAVTNMEGMLQGCGMSCENLSVTLDSWKTQATALNKNNINLGTLNADQYYNQTGQAAITALQTRGWTITGGTYAADCLTPKSWFVTVWDLTKPTNRTNHNPASTISFGVSGSNYKIYWEDVNNPSTHDTLTVPGSSFVSRFYLTVPAGTTKVRIKAYKGRGSLNSLRNMCFDDPERLIAVEQWGTAQWSSFEYAFHLCKNMDVTATDRPNLTACTSLGGMFHKCTSLVNANGSISSWNTENITTMLGMFSGATSFNQPLNWNTENVTDMAEMFEGATSFNQPLNWNTEKVTTMQAMFAEATSFNQPLNFNTQNVTRLGSMFSKATSFNQPLDFNTQNVIYMNFMFEGATSFNQPINWNIPNVISMEFMFSGATSFNRPFGSTFTSSMSNTQDMGRMFEGATSFDQSLNDFKIDAVYSMYNMLKGSGISCENLSTTLDSWATQATTLGKNNINLYDITTVPNMYNEMGRDAITALQARNWYICLLYTSDAADD